MNAMVLTLMRRYLDFDVFAEKYNLVNVPESVLNGITELLDEKQLALLTSQVARSRPLEYLDWKGKETTTENLVDYVCNHLLRNCRFGIGEADLRDGIWNVTLKGRSEGFTRWAKFYVPALFKEHVGLQPQMSILDNMIRFTIPDKTPIITQRETAKELLAPAE